MARISVCESSHVVATGVVKQGQGHRNNEPRMKEANEKERKKGGKKGEKKRKEKKGRKKEKEKLWLRWFLFA